MNEVINLFCIPHAGGLANFFKIWDPFFADTNVKLMPLEMKGHGSRFNEPNYSSIEDAAIDSLRQIQEIQMETNNPPYALIGHSMGSYIVFEILRLLNQNEYVLPMAVFMSGKGAPIAVKEIKISQLSDQQFMNEIGTLGEISEELQKYSNLLSIFASIIKSDYRAVEQYDHQKKYILTQKNVCVLNGSQDIYATHENKKAWQQYFTDPISYEDFSGGHFFIKDNAKEVTEYIYQKLVQAQHKEGVR